MTAPAATPEDTDYKRTIFKMEKPASPNLTQKIRLEIQRNDHTAKVFLNQHQKILFIIHHKSISVNDLERVIAGLGISVHAVSQSNFPAKTMVLMSRSLSSSFGSYRN